MKKNIILCGVGGQGILTISRVLVNAALNEGLHFKQAEVHGMSQRGGSVYAHLRLSEKHIYSPTIPVGEADLVLAMEPLEALKHARFLSEKGAFISSSAKLPNIEYEEKPVLAEIKRLGGRLIDSKLLAERAGNALAQNMVLLGSASEAIGLGEKTVKDAVRGVFGGKGGKVIELNLRAFELGKQA